MRKGQTVIIPKSYQNHAVAWEFNVLLPQGALTALAECVFICEQHSHPRDSQHSQCDMHSLERGRKGGRRWSNLQVEGCKCKYWQCEQEKAVALSPWGKTVTATSPISSPSLSHSTSPCCSLHRTIQTWDSMCNTAAGAVIIIHTQSTVYTVI